MTHLPPSVHFPEMDSRPELYRDFPLSLLIWDSSYLAHDPCSRSFSKSCAPKHTALVPCASPHCLVIDNPRMCALHLGAVLTGNIFPFQTDVITTAIIH